VQAHPARSTWPSDFLPNRFFLLRCIRSAKSPHEPPATKSTLRCRICRSYTTRCICRDNTACCSIKLFGNKSVKYQLITFAVGVMLIASCSSQKSHEETLPIFLSITGGEFQRFGPVSTQAAISDSIQIDGTQHSVSVYCESHTDRHANLVFQLYSKEGVLVHEEKRKVEVGAESTFVIFSNIEVTLYNEI